MHFYEDLHALGRSSKYVHRVDTDISVLNTQNRRQGIRARRGDGSFGEIVPNVSPIKDKGFIVSRGPIATIEIGIEVKILMKAMLKQIDRVAKDLREQVTDFKSHSGKPICIGVAGINHADHCTTYERDRAWPTDGSEYRHPIQEAYEAEKRLMQLAAPAFDEFLVLRFKATNEPPYSFTWVDEKESNLNYGAILARVSQRYEQDHK